MFRVTGGRNPIPLLELASFGRRLVERRVSKPTRPEYPFGFDIAALAAPLATF